MKNSQKGFTLYELVVCLFGVAWLAAVVSIVWVAVHFIAKFW